MVTQCGRCHTEIKDDNFRESMHYGKIHNSCHDKMIDSLGDKK